LQKAVTGDNLSLAEAATWRSPGELPLTRVSRISGPLLARLVAAATACAAATALAGYSKGAEAVVDKVIAHVGLDEVTQQEVDNELRLAKVPPDKRDEQTLKAILSQVIARKYMVRHALAAKLDQEPQVSLDLLRSREQVLAGAYAQHGLAVKTSAIAKADIDGYIQAHPAQFAKRQLFQIEQVSFPPLKDMGGLTAATKDFKSLDQVEAKLNELGIKFNRGTGTLDGATIAPELLKVLLVRNPVDIFFVSSKTSATFFKVASVEEKPLTDEDAYKFAKQELSADFTRKMAQQIMDAALATAKYEGDYVHVMATPTPAAKVQIPSASGEEPAAEKEPTSKTLRESPKN
jgi:EpsD family peptidyl-prolyl cis-trans isomerase